ncbi:MAG: DNA gyrase inhibitor YacG [Candidatus Dadabacteria bacterium]|nr:DNA gyrase inhibitor YacG [Candidatus Dadabacteria bacterium]NIS07539.1 DNA gyrase inhibitor YacG [Candidatus Dadabacteria bacterium]NIY22906.1 DNA gyrase inhibitor YacG [Candidatus Dadabacteria bacterium]
MNVKCPTCKKEIEWEDAVYRPFCSERCKMIDLGTWANEQYSMPTEDAIDFEQMSENEEVH